MTDPRDTMLRSGYARVKDSKTLREEIEEGLRMSFSDAGGNPVIYTHKAAEALERLILREKRAAVEDFVDRVMKLEPHILRDIENDFGSEEERLYSRLCTVLCDIFGPPAKLTESNLVDASEFPHP